MNPLKALRDARTIGRLLTDAEQVARRMGDERPAAEHLLIAAMAMPDGSAARVLASFDTGVAQLEDAVQEEHAAGLVAAGVDPDVAARMAEPAPILPANAPGVYRSEASAQELFQAAGAAARRAGQRLTGAHVALAAAGVAHGTLARALERLGIDREALRDAAGRELARSA